MSDLTAWVELNLKSLEFNIKQIQKHTNNTDIIAVVKGNAYGHGVLEIIPTLLNNNIKKVAVVSLNEAIEIREQFSDISILILSFTPLNYCEKLWEYNLEQCVFYYEYAKHLDSIANKNNKIIHIHIKIDTGMGRLGFLPNNENIEQITKIYNMKNLNVFGICSHFASSDSFDKTYSLVQFEKYLYVIQKLEEAGVKNIGLKHIANSGAVLDMKETHMDCIRPGIILYGFFPSNEVQNKLILKPVLLLKCKIISLQCIEKGSSVGYNHSFITKRKSKIAVLPLGYNEGYSKILENKSHALINNKLAPIVSICMNLCMTDVTDIENVNIGDVVTLYGDVENIKEININHISKLSETIPYEILCKINCRLQRICVNNFNLFD